MDNFLQNVSLFKGLSDSDIERLYNVSETITLIAGQNLFEEGSSGDKLFIIKQGELDILTGSGRTEQLLATRQPGDVIGEMSLLDDEPRSATARGKTDCVLLSISREQFDTLLDMSRTASKAILRTVTPRWRENEAVLRQNEQIVREQADMLERTITALQMAHDELEGRVVERTAELATTNTDLKEQVAERKRAEEQLAEINQNLEAKVQERTIQLEEQIDQLSTLNLITHTVASVRELNIVLKVVARAMVELFYVQGCGIALLNETRTELTVITSYSNDPTVASTEGLVIPVKNNPSSSRVIETGSSMVIDKAQTNPLVASIHNIIREQGIQALVLVPLKVRGQVIGTIGLDIVDPEREFSQADVSLAETVAGQMAGAIENARLFETERKSREQAETLYAASQALSSTLDLHDIFELILQELRKVVPYDSASVQRLKGNKLEIIGGIGFENMADIEGTIIDLRISDTPNREVVQTKKPLILSNVASHYAAFAETPESERISSWLGVPLLFGDRLIGMITLDKQELNFYNDQHAHLVMTFASQGAVAIENARLYTEAEEARQRLTEENLRMGAELEVTRQLQQMILPTRDELQRVDGLDIAGYMEPAEEVGGDYYDVLQHEGQVKIGIGDVTGHGLHSGILMLMTQTAVRTLLTSGEVDTSRFMDILNRTIYDNIQRMEADKSLTLNLLDYEAHTPEKQLALNGYVGQVRLSGQHEELIIVRGEGEVELVDTFDLGFPIGLDQDIIEFVDEKIIHLEPGDGVVLYTDGITESENMAGEQYGIIRLCRVVSRFWLKSAEGIKEAVVKDVYQHIGKQTIYDDLTLVVVKQK
ncbi:GAF domain-containing protein, partial [Anaerolineales bacterium HSG25]|nr:GAF domain-containing protein [Anaerolineales bacterium HSG25]